MVSGAGTLVQAQTLYSLAVHVVQEQITLWLQSLVGTMAKVNLFVPLSRQDDGSRGK